MYTSCTPAPNPLPLGGARLLLHQWRHPRGLGQDGVIPRGHVSQWWAAGPAEGPAEGVDVEPDSGEHPPPLPEPPQCERRSTEAGGEGHQGRHIPRPGRRPASQSLPVVIEINGTLILNGLMTLGISIPGQRDNMSSWIGGWHKMKTSHSCSNPQNWNPASSETSRSARRVLPAVNWDGGQKNDTSRSRFELWDQKRNEMSQLL